MIEIKYKKGVIPKIQTAWDSQFESKLQQKIDYVDRQTERFLKSFGEIYEYENFRGEIFI